MAIPKTLFASKLAERFLQIPREKQVGIVSAGILLSALTLGWLAVQQPYEGRRSLLENRIQQESKRTAILSHLASISGELLKIRSALLIQGGTPALTRQVTQLASQAGVRIESVSPQPEMTFGPYTRVQVRVVGACAYAQWVAFLRLLERHEPLLKIDELEVGERAQVLRRAKGASGQPSQPPAKEEENLPDQPSVQWVIGAFSQREASS